MTEQGTPYAWQNTAVRRLILLSTLTVVFLLGGCFFIDTIVQHLALRPLARQAGTTPTKAALVRHVNAILAGQKGHSREHVHQALENVGGSFQYRDDAVRGERRESVYWTLAELPGGFKIWAVWILSFNKQNELTQFVTGESP